MFRDVTHPTYDEIHTYCGEVAKEILKSRSLVYKHILGLNRGGFIPAVILSHLLNLPVIPISYSSKQGEGDKTYSNELPTLDLTQFPVLLVDDVAGTGHTFREIKAYYGAGVVDTFVLINKSPYATEYGYRVPQSTGWIVFPWEGR